MNKVFYIIIPPTPFSFHDEKGALFTDKK